MSVKQQINLDELISRLYNADIWSDWTKTVSISPQECIAVCQLVIRRMKLEPVCLKLATPILVVGDLHGQFHDLMRIFEVLGRPPIEKYLFLGDYVDRGRRSIEVLMLLYALKVKSPQSVFLLRGNHEAANVCLRYGFRDEVEQRYERGDARRVMRAFLRSFQWMPLCAKVGVCCFCCHGGVSPLFHFPPFSAGRLAAEAPSGRGIEALDDIQRPLEPSHCGVAVDLLWADPMPQQHHAYLDSVAEKTPLRWAPSPRGCSYLFNEDAVRAILLSFGVGRLIRGHQVPQSGFSRSLGGLCLTVFSASGYCGVSANSGAVMRLKPAKSPADWASTVYRFQPTKLSQRTKEQLYWASE